VATIQRVLYEIVGVDKASGAFDSAGRSAATAESRISKLGKGVVVAGGLIAGAAAAIGVESVRMATSFQASMEKIHTQAGGTQKDVTQLSAAVLRMKNAQQGPQELADALYHLKSLGLGNAAAMKALAQASNLAAVGGANVEQTATAIGAAWRSGVKGAQSFGQAAGTVNAIIGAGNMQMEDLISALGSGILPAARTFGVSFQSVGAALAVMTDEGIPAELAATRLRMSLSLIGAPSQQAAKQLATIGLSSTALANAMRGPEGILGAITLLKTKLDDSGLSATRQAQILSRAFGGGQSSSAILTLVNNLNTLKTKQDQVNRTTGDYGKDVAAQRKTAAAQFAILRSDVEQIGTRIGMSLLPPVTRFASFLASTVVPGAVKAARTVGRVFNQIIPVKAIEDDWRSLMRFLGGSKPPAPEAPVPFTGSGSVSKLAAPANVDTFYGGMAPDPRKLTDSFSKVNWGQVIGTAIGSAVKASGQIGAAILKMFASVNWANVGKSAVFAAVPFVISFVNNLLGALISEAIHHPLDLALFLINLIPIGRGAGILLDIFDKIPVLGVLSKVFLKPLVALGDLMDKLLTKTLRGVFGGVEKLILHFFPNAGSWLVGKGENLIIGLLSGIETRWPRVASWLLGLITKIPNLLASAPHWLLVVGGDIILGMLGGIRAKMAGIGRWVKGNIIDPVVSAVKGFFGIHSPSTVFHGIGLNLVAGLLRGLATTDGEAIAKTVFGSLPKALGSIVKKGLVTIESLPGKALSALGGLGSGILSLLGIGGGGATSTGGAVNLGKTMAAVLGWTGAQWTALNELWTRESGWNYQATNPSSGAYGIPQALPASKMASAGADWRTDPATQIRWGLSYIAQRYGSPLNAWAHEQAFNWYATGTGGKGAMPGWAWVGERGPELVRFRGGEDVLDAGTSKAVTRGYASGTSLAKLGRELLRSHHKGVLDIEVANTRKRYNSEHLLATAPGLGSAKRKHYAAMAAADHKRLVSLNHTLAAERAYRGQLNSRVRVLQATEAAARKEKMPGEAASLAKRIKADQAIIAHINEWTAGKASFAKAASKTASKTGTTASAAPSGNLDIADWAALLSALAGGSAVPAFAKGSMYVPATGPAIVHKGEMILPADVADAIRSGGGGGDVHVYVELDGQPIEPRMIRVADERIERRDRRANRLIKAGTGRR